MKNLEKELVECRMHGIKAQEEIETLTGIVSTLRKVIADLEAEKVRIQFSKSFSDILSAYWFI